MKIIVFLFSLYLLALPGISCAQSIGCANEIQNSTAKSENGKQHQDEDCGTFCTCTCCVHVVTVNQFLSQAVIINNTGNHHNYFNYSKHKIPSNYFGNIWQPPRIS
ncbi:MAG: hypothetical protein KF741_06270 [Ferruginibacter sp.]|nr:hypothetical protein [Bacteroidota bacterium]MBX2918835.1 hypothetical protein [Ferruginibacter sp.]MCC7379687.1 hypothetical protein [Chitinophagaceae bacterium]